MRIATPHSIDLRRARVESGWLADFHAGARATLDRVFRDQLEAVSTAVARVLEGVDHETVVHEVFLRLFTDERLRRGFNGGSLGGWMVRLARDQAHEYRRRRDVLSGGDEAAPAVQETAAARRLLDRFRAEVLPARRARLFELRFVQRRDRRAAARSLALNPLRLVVQEHRLRYLLAGYLRDSEGSRLCPHRRSVEQHFDGSIATHDERVLRRHLPSCDECRALYQRLLWGTRLDPRALSAEERLARGLGLRPLPPQRLGIAVLAMVVALIACALLAGMRPWRLGLTWRDSSEPAARSELLVYAAPGEARLPLRIANGAHVDTASELAFAYRNPEGFAQLCIFGLDEHRHIYWYQPAAGISRSQAPVTLAATPVHLGDVHRLRLYALFSSAGLSVEEVERVVRAGDEERWLPAGGRKLTLDLDVGG
jgi:RNA polymerase sigma-70 factor, ECF subfamily